MWRSVEERLALLELLLRGTLKRRSVQAAAWEALSELPWTRRTGRRSELGLVENRRGELVALLDRVWAAWRAAVAELIARGLPPTPEGWSALEDARRAEALPLLPDQLNRRTIASLVAPHSKAVLTERRLGALGPVRATHDGAVRLRPPAGLVARVPGGTLDLTSVARLLGEVSIPERALERRLELVGPMRAVLLIENLGTFCDLPLLDGWLFVHVAGWDTPTVARFLQCVVHVPAVQFGDLDPNGVRIFQHLRALRADLRWFVPQHWEEYVEARALRGGWPEELDLRDAPVLVQRLARDGLWLEQEPLSVDVRTPGALEELLEAC